MKKLSTIILSLFFIGVISAQKWKGSTTINGNLYRNGNVGIGTKTPSNKLDVNGKLRVRGFVLTHDGADFVLGANDGRSKGSRKAQRALVHGTQDKLYLNFANDFEGGTIIGGSQTSILGKLRVRGFVLTHDGADFVLGANDGRSKGSRKAQRALVHGTQDRLYLNFANDFEGGTVIGGFQTSILGKLGIGTTNPGAYKLAVNGKVRAKEVVVETGWSDFVFEKDYKLPTLKEVEQHIKKHGHLKDIPSAKEVAEKGVKLGQMDSKLLQKIEELTLYIIKQNKRIELLESKLNQN